MSEEPEGEELVEWLRWLDERPESVRKAVALRPPWKDYRIIGARGARHVGEVYRIRSYDEMDDDTVRVSVFMVRPRIELLQRAVFGLQPSDLEEEAS